MQKLFPFLACELSSEEAICWPCGQASACVPSDKVMTYDNLFRVSNAHFVKKLISRAASLKKLSVPEILRA